MATATPSFAPVAPVAPRAAAALIPSHLPAWQRRDIVHSGELALTNGLALLCRIARGDEAEPAWIISSSSRVGFGHVVTVDEGRINCDCAARTIGHRWTCSHAQFVRLLIIAERVEARSAPAAISSPRPAPAPEPAPEPAPAPAPKPDDDPPPSGGPVAGGSGGSGGADRCPTCGAHADRAEIADLGECLNCVQMRADYAREDERAEALAAELAQAELEARLQAEEAAKAEAEALPCWACGATATAETDHGLYCDECVSLPRPELRRRIARRNAAQNIAAREEARTRAGIPSDASPRARRAQTRD